MSDDIRSFTVRMDRFAGKTVPQAVKDRRDALALGVHGGVVMMTPVDTGRLRANWQVTTGAPAEGAIDVTDKSGAATVSKGVAIIEGASDPFEAIWIHNGLPYATYIDQGTPTITATHMVARTIARFKRLFS